jgi:hypothetical protein
MAQANLSMKKSTIILLTLSAFICLASCYYDKEELLYPGGSDCQLNAKFAANVNPIIQTKCAMAPECHGSGSTNYAGPLTNYNLIHNLAPAIKVQVVTGTMPKTGSLTAQELQTIVCWIDAGAQNN